MQHSRHKTALLLISAFLLSARAWAGTATVEIAPWSFTVLRLKTR